MPTSPPTAPCSPVSLLTNRQRQVMDLVASGRTTPEIATELRIGIRTVETLIRQSCDRLGATTRRAAIHVLRSSTQRTDGPHEPLSVAERLVVEIARGRSVKEAARSIGVSLRTAHRVLSRQRAERGVRSTTQLIVALADDRVI